MPLIAGRCSDGDTTGLSALKAFVDAFSKTSKYDSLSIDNENKISLGPLGFEEWELAYERVSSSHYIWLRCRGRTNQTTYVTISPATYGLSSGGMHMKCVIAYDDPMDSLLSIFYSGEGEASPTDNTLYRNNAFFIFSIAKDIEGGVAAYIRNGTNAYDYTMVGDSGNSVGNISYKSTSALLGLSGDMIMQGKHNELSPNITNTDLLCLTRMPNFTKVNTMPLMKSMMITVALPSFDVNDLKFGEYYEINGKPYANFQNHILQRRPGLLDMWCPF